MQDYLKARDRCEEHMHAAIDALITATGAWDAYRWPDDRTAARAEALTIAAREIAAAQAANDSAARPTPEADPPAPEPGAVERALRRLAGD